MLKRSTYSPEAIQRTLRRKNTDVEEMKVDGVRGPRELKFGISEKAQCCRKALDDAVTIPQESDEPIGCLRC